MGKLEDIGFYTLEDRRAINASIDSPLWRCELIVTGACNFRCPYCRQVGATLNLENAMRIVDTWTMHNLQNIRFSGGEPTIWYGLLELVKYTKAQNVKRIAISTNGSAPLEQYKELIDAGVNDISISLDACCASTGDMMAGGIEGAWKRVTQNIKALSKLTYVTVGIVVTEDNLPEVRQTILFASEELGVADIRVIPAAQWNQDIISQINISQEILERHPILKYRFTSGSSLRGISDSDAHNCGIVLDDMAVMGDNHYPCIIYMREGGKSIDSLKNGRGELKTIKEIRLERKRWMEEHDTSCDKICRANCLDVCVQYNNTFKMAHT